MEKYSVDQKCSNCKGIWIEEFGDLSSNRIDNGFTIKNYGCPVYQENAVKEFIKKLKEKVVWGKNHGNGDVNSTKAILEHIDKLAGSDLT